jgi:hypothetical protein
VVGLFPTCFPSNNVKELLNHSILITCSTHLIESRDSSVSIALGYRLDDRGSRVRFPAEAGNFSLHHRVQNGSGAHPASYPMGTRSSFPWGKAAEAWSWPLISIQCRGQRMSKAIPPLPQYAFMAWCLVKAQGHLYLYPSHRPRFDNPEYKLWSSSLCSFFQAPATSSLLGPHILLSALFSNTIHVSRLGRQRTLHKQNNR